MLNSTQYKKYDSYFRNINKVDNPSSVSSTSVNRFINETKPSLIQQYNPNNHIVKIKQASSNYSEYEKSNGNFTNSNNINLSIPTKFSPNFQTQHFDHTIIKSIKPDCDFLDESKNSPLKKYEEKLPFLDSDECDYDKPPKINIKNSEVFIYDFKIIRQVSKVNFCDLFSVNHKGTIKHIQLIPKSNLFSNKNSIEMLKYLVNQANKMNHPCLLNIENLYSNNTEIYILGEKLPSLNLADFLSIEWPNEGQSKQIMKGIFESLSFLHSKGILHKNLTLSSIFIEPKTLDVKIGFYSYSDILNLNALPLEYNSIPFYNPPEKTLNFEYVAESDIWISGLILLLLLTKEIPFQSNELHYLLIDIKNFDIENYLKNYSKKMKAISSDAQDLLIKLMKRVPNERLNAKEALMHKWFDSLSYLNYKSILSDKSTFLSEWIFQHSITNYVSSYMKIIELIENFNLNCSKISNLTLSDLPNLIENHFGKLFNLEESLLETKDKTIQDLLNIICSIFFKIKTEYSEAGLKKSFKEFDKNNDGFINVYEISKGRYAYKSIIEKLIDNYSQESTQIDFYEMKKIIQFNLIRKNYVSHLKMITPKSETAIR